MKKPLLAALFPLAVCPAYADVPAAEVTLQPVITANIPAFTTLSAYQMRENPGDNWGQKDLPIYYPYNFAQPAAWDNMVAEVLQARLPSIMCASRGGYTTDPADLEGPGNLNPKNLRQLVAAIQRAKATNVLKVACFIDSPAMRETYVRQYGLLSNAPFDIADEDGWRDVVWERTVMPWFDTVPTSYWYRINNKPVIQWWGFHPGWSINHAGNARRMFQYIGDQFYARYGVRPAFILPSDLETSWNQDPGVKNQQDVIGLNPWFATPNQPALYLAHNGVTTGTAVPGFIDPGFFDPANGNYGNYNRVIFRNKIDGTGVMGDTLKIGLTEAITQKSTLTTLEGWTDQAEWAGYYRSRDVEWLSANQYIDIVRSFSDPRTVTLKLEAEGADVYGDNTAGNSGGAFLRGNESLDVRALTGSPAVTASTAASAGALANDGKLSTKWVTTSAAPGWLQLDAGEGNSHVATGYHLACADVQARDPKNWQFQGSNNGTSWVTLDSRTNQTFSVRNRSNSYTFSNTTAYRFYRLDVSATYGGGTNPIAVAELALDPVTNSMGGGWAVTDTSAGEYLEFKNFTFSPGNYKYAIRYSTVTPNRRVRLKVDNVDKGIVTLPVTSSMNTFATINLGQATFTTGTHTMRLEFLDSGVDVDWLFVKKSDQLISLQAYDATDSKWKYVCSLQGGNDSVVANRESASIWEKFSANDHNGGVLTHDDQISLQTYNGMLLSAELGGGGGLSANRRALGGWERFTISKTSGTGAIATGDTVTLRSSNGNYLTVGAGLKVDVTGTGTPGTLQTFKITLQGEQ